MYQQVTAPTDRANPVPPELGNLENLVELVLGDNQLTGLVPSELGNLDRLWALMLRNSPLSGPLPSTMTGLRALDYLWLDRTDLCVPTGASWDALLATVQSFRGVRCPAAP